MQGLVGLLDRRREAKRAGGSARAEYERLKREWRRRMRPRFVLLGVIFAAITIFFWVLAAIWPRLEFTSGLVSGALMAMFLALRESPPGWVDQWLTGAQGEQWTDEQLRKLERRAGSSCATRSKEGETSIMSRSVHLASSSSTRRTSTARVTCSADELRLHRPGSVENASPAYVTTDPARGVRRQAAQLNERLRRRVGKSLWVSGVVAVWADLQPDAVAGKHMHFVRGDSLADWLQQQPNKAG